MVLLKLDLANIKEKSLTFFLQEGLSGGQGALAYLRVLQKFYGSCNLERDKSDLFPRNHVMWVTLKETDAVNTLNKSLDLP